jgi:hypothetical protein
MMPPKEPAPPTGIASRRESLRKDAEPEVFYVRAHRRGGYCVMIEQRATPLTRHDTPRDAMLLAESLAKKLNARVVVEE